MHKLDDFLALSQGDQRVAGFYDPAAPPTDLGEPARICEEATEQRWWDGKRCSGGLWNRAHFLAERVRALEIIREWRPFTTAFLQRHGRKPRLLEGMCGGGGCTRGFLLAGFEVHGVDRDDQPGYTLLPNCKFYRLDLSDKDAVRTLISDIRPDCLSASPPCQKFSSAWRMGGAASTSPDLLTPMREVFLEYPHLPYVLENVRGAKDAMLSPLEISGFSCGLGVARPRLWEAGGHHLPTSAGSAPALTSSWRPLLAAMFEDLLDGMGRLVEGKCVGAHGRMGRMKKGRSQDPLLLSR